MILLENIDMILLDRYDFRYDFTRKYIHMLYN